MNSSPLRPLFLSLLFLWQGASPDATPVNHFRYQRTVTPPSPSVSAAQTCAVLDANVFAHAAPSLKDLRLFSGRIEVPYATTLSEPLQQESEDAQILNLRSNNFGNILFDLDMPHRPYTGLSLDLAARDYIAQATVSGSESVHSDKVTPLGTFALFDLTTQHLSHLTDIPLPESTFAYLHINLKLSSASGSNTTSPLLNFPGIVKSVTIPPSREAQSLYTTTQRAMAVQEGQESVARFNVQSRVPVERVTFTLPKGDNRSFSRKIRIEARGIPEVISKAQEGANTSGAPFESETVTGSILRVHRSEGGHPLSAENLSIPVSIGSNMQQPAVIEVKLEDGSDAPLPLSIELQMRQRRICFDSLTAPAPLTLYYGDPSLDAPMYRNPALRQAAANPRIAELGPETQNAFAAAALPSRKFNRHRPILRWIALLGGVCIFALLTIRSTHSRRH